MKLAIVSDLMSLKALFILVICLHNKTMIFFKFAELIEIKTCFLEEPCIIMLNLSLSFFGLLINFCISLIFLVERLESYS